MAISLGGAHAGQRGLKPAQAADFLLPEPRAMAIPMSGRAGTVRQPGFTESAEHGSGAGPAFQPREEGPGVPMTSGWPLQSYLELAALPSAVPCARLHTRQVLWEWGLGAAAETVELLVSELVTNGHAPRGALLYPRCSREELKGGSWA
jgi:hypothetical protein